MTTTPTSAGALQCPECDAAMAVEPNQLYIHALVTGLTLQARVHIAWGSQRGQLTLQDARAHAQSLHEATEAAAYDAAVTNMLKTKGVSFEDACKFLAEMRRFRSDA